MAFALPPHLLRDAAIEPHQAGLDALTPDLLARMRVVAGIKVQHAPTGGPTVDAIAIDPPLIEFPRVAIHQFKSLTKNTSKLYLF